MLRKSLMWSYASLSLLGLIFIVPEYASALRLENMLQIIELKYFAKHKKAVLNT